jgi:hypothetical protein
MTDNKEAVTTIGKFYEPPTVLEIRKSDNSILVSIGPNGVLTYGPDYTPDAAAVVFWEALAEMGIGIASARIAELKSALRKYGRHAEDCIKTARPLGRWSCECGLDDAFK